LWGIKNLSSDGWTVTAENAEAKPVVSGGVVPVAVNATVQFNGKNGKIVKA
jgi:hypothetical protein